MFASRTAIFSLTLQPGRSPPVPGQQIAELLPNDGAAVDLFGGSVAISGTTAIVGAWWNDDNGHRSGSGYLFDTTTGRQIAKLLPDDGAALDFFGFSVAISGAITLVGAYGDDDNGDFSGSAYLLDAAASGMCPWDLDANGRRVEQPTTLAWASSISCALLHRSEARFCSSPYDGWRA